MSKISVRRKRGHLTTLNNKGKTHHVALTPFWIDPHRKTIHTSFNPSVVAEHYSDPGFSRRYLENHLEIVSSNAGAFTKDIANAILYLGKEHGYSISYKNQMLLTTDGRMIIPPSNWWLNNEKPDIFDIHLIEMDPSQLSTVKGSDYIIVYPSLNDTGGGYDYRKTMGFNQYVYSWHPKPLANKGLVIRLN